MRSLSFVILGVAMGLFVASALAQTMTHSPGSTYFTDVSPSSTFDHDIGFIYEYGVAGGYGDGRYGPGDLVTREQMAAYIMRQAAADTVLATVIIDDLYFDGYYFGYTAYQEGRISYDDYETMQSLLAWYIDLLDYQVSGPASPGKGPVGLANVAAARVLGNTLRR